MTLEFVQHVPPELETAEAEQEAARGQAKIIAWPPVVRTAGALPQSDLIARSCPRRGSIVVEARTFLTNQDWARLAEPGTELWFLAK